MTIISLRTLFTLISCLAIAVPAQLVQFQLPTANQQVNNGDTVVLSWTVIGENAGNGVSGGFTGLFNSNLIFLLVSPPLSDSNYPNSLTLYYSWVKKTDPTTKYQIQAIQNLGTTPSSDPSKNQTYTSSWKVPNCRMFYRYPPDQFTFSFVALPVYASQQVSSMHLSPIQINLNMINNINTFPKC
ncbi:hypothetical protein NQZ79_g140 [Umbelopsis isabellina]|nr:hypothetical protein NQZ79_g140 [Umbelopsis isabellina]